MEQKNGSLTARWRLNKKSCTSQKQVLKLMGRAAWEIYFIDDADEDFRLLHFKRDRPDRSQLHFFDKYVKITLNSKFLKGVSIFWPNVNKVEYKHSLVANKNPKNHRDDQKKFGPCISRTSWESNNQGRVGFMIRWYLKNGLLKVFHYVNQEDQLCVTMYFENKQGETAECVKLYDRVQWTDFDKLYIKSHKYHNKLQ